MIAEKYQLSRIPVRDVFQQLKNEGWLSDHGKCGLMVSPLNAREAEDLYLMRMQLEPLILGFAIPHITHQHLGQATDILESLEQPHLTIDQYGELNWEFHSTIYQAAERHALFNTLEHLHTLCGRYIGFHSLKLDYATTSQGEHYALLELIRQKDRQSAQQLLSQHIRAAGKIITTHIKNIPSPC